MRLSRSLRFGFSNMESLTPPSPCAGFDRLSGAPHVPGPDGAGVFGEDPRLPAFKLGLGCDIADRTVQPHTIVVFYISRHQVLRIG
jgi:hypothetical protein